MGELLIAFGYLITGVIIGGAAMFIFGTHYLVGTTKKLFAKELESIGYKMTDNGVLEPIEPTS